MLLGICLLLSTKLISVLVCGGLRLKISRAFWKQLKNQNIILSTLPPSGGRQYVKAESAGPPLGHSFLELGVSIAWKREWGRMGLQGCSYLVEHSLQTGNALWEGGRLNQHCMLCAVPKSLLVKRDKSKQRRKTLRMGRLSYPTYFSGKKTNL